MQSLPDPARGVVYVATGERFVEAARLSARSVRRSNPGLPIALFGGEGSPAAAGGDADFELVLPIVNPHRRSKVDYVAASPFERTLYLDADIRVYADLAPMFALLDRFEIALNHAHARNRARTNTTWRVALPEAFPQFNGGVIVYRNTPPVKAFLADWATAYHASGFRKDQVTLRELLWESNLRIATLPPEYNVRYLKYLWLWARKEAAPKIIHHRWFVDGGWRARALDALLVRLLPKPNVPAPRAHDGPERKCW